MISAEWVCSGEVGQVTVTLRQLRCPCEQLRCRAHKPTTRAHEELMITEAEPVQLA